MSVFTFKGIHRKSLPSLGSCFILSSFYNTLPPLTSCLPPAAILWRAGPALCLGYTIEPTPLAEVWVNQPQSCEHGRTVPITHLSCGGMVGERCPVPPCPSMPEAGGGAGLEVLGVGELSLPLISCSTQKNGPYAILGQHSRTGPGVGEEIQP